MFACTLILFFGVRIVTNNPNSAFQGKKVISTLAASIMGNPFHPNNQGLSR